MVNVYRSRLLKFKIMLALALSLGIARAVLADTVIFKSGSTQKGIVVEDYDDRILLSTVEGEKQIKKDGIKDIIYSAREQNLVKLGDFYLAKNNYVAAYSYYRKACQVNPSYKEARDKLAQARSAIIIRTDRVMDIEIAKQKMISQFEGRVFEPAVKEGMSDTEQDRLKKSAGFTLASDNEMPIVDMVYPDSPAAMAGLKKGDLIYAVWGRLCGYQEISATAKTILDNPSSIILLTLKKNLSLGLDDKPYRGYADLGLDLALKEEGIVVTGVKEFSAAERAGLSRGDMILSINNESTRYMPLKKFIEKLGVSAASKNLELEIARDINLYKRGA